MRKSYFFIYVDKISKNKREKIKRTLILEYNIEKKQGK